MQKHKHGDRRREKKNRNEMKAVLHYCSLGGSTVFQIELLTYSTRVQVLVTYCTNVSAKR